MQGNENGPDGDTRTSCQSLVWDVWSLISSLLRLSHSPFSYPLSVLFYFPLFLLHCSVVWIWKIEAADCLAYAFSLLVARMILCQAAAASDGTEHSVEGSEGIICEDIRFSMYIAIFGFMYTIIQSAAQ